MNKYKFKPVSAFSKIPFHLRNTTIYIVYIMLLALIPITHYKFDIEYHIAKYFTLLLLLAAYTVYIIKAKYKLKYSTFIKLLDYIYINKLFEVDTLETGYNKHGYPIKKRVITNSAHFSYRETDSELIIRAWKRADKYTDLASSHDTMLSALFGKELYKKYDDVQFCDYVFQLVPDKRLSMEEKKFSENMLIRMTDKISWSLGNPPHTIIVGSTNSGKTFLVSMLILDYLRMGAELFIADPKSADLSIIGQIIDVQLKRTQNNRAVSENEIAELFRRVNTEMETRYATWFSNESAFSKTWRDIPNAKPIVFIFDEYSAFVAVASSKVLKEVNGYLFNLILKGRQAGIEVLLIMQRPDASILSGNIRDQFGVRIGLSNMTDDGRKMLFGSVNIDYKTIKEIGGGYISINGIHENPVYFEAPLLSGGLDYIEELHKAVDGRT